MKTPKTKNQFENFHSENIPGKIKKEDITWDEQLGEESWMCKQDKITDDSNFEETMENHYKNRTFAFNNLMNFSIDPGQNTEMSYPNLDFLNNFGKYFYIDEKCLCDVSAQIEREIPEIESTIETNKYFRKVEQGTKENQKNVDDILGNKEECKKFLKDVEIQKNMDEKLSPFEIRILTQNLHFRPTNSSIANVQICNGVSNFQNVQYRRACEFAGTISELDKDNNREKPHIICIQEATDTKANDHLYKNLEKIGYTCITDDELGNWTKKGYFKRFPNLKRWVDKSWMNMPGLAICVDHTKGFKIKMSDNFTFLSSGAFSNEDIGELVETTGFGGADAIGFKGGLFSLIEVPSKWNGKTGNGYILVGTVHPSPYVNVEGALGYIMPNADNYEKILMIHRYQLDYTNNYVNAFLSAITEYTGKGKPESIKENNKAMREELFKKYEKEWKTGRKEGAEERDNYFEKKWTKWKNRIIGKLRENEMPEDFKLGGVFITGDMNINRYAGEADGKLEKKYEHGSQCCSAEFYQMLRRLESDQPPVLPDINEERWIEYFKGFDKETNSYKYFPDTRFNRYKYDINKYELKNYQGNKGKITVEESYDGLQRYLENLTNDEDKQKISKIINENFEKIIRSKTKKFPPGFGGLYTWDAALNKICEDPLWPGSFQWIDYVLYYHGFNKFDNIFEGNDPIPLYMDNRALRLKTKNKFPELSKYYVKQLCGNENNYVLENKINQDDYKNFKDYTNTYNYYDGNTKKNETITCKFNPEENQAYHNTNATQNYDSYFKENKNNPFKMLEDVSDHYGVLSRIVLPSNRNQKIDSNIRYKLLKLPVEQAQRTPSQNKWDMYRYSSLWRKLGIFEETEILSDNTEIYDLEDYKRIIKNLYENEENKLFGKVREIIQQIYKSATDENLSNKKFEDKYGSTFDSIIDKLLESGDKRSLLLKIFSIMSHEVSHKIMTKYVERLRGPESKRRLKDKKIEEHIKTVRTKLTGTLGNICENNNLDNLKKLNGLSRKYIKIEIGGEGDKKIDEIDLSGKDSKIIIKLKNDLMLTEPFEVKFCIALKFPKEKEFFHISIDKQTYIIGGIIFDVKKLEDGIMKKIGEINRNKKIEAHKKNTGTPKLIHEFDDVPQMHIVAIIYWGGKIYMGSEINHKKWNELWSKIKNKLKTSEDSGQDLSGSQLDMSWHLVQAQGQGQK